MVFTSDRTVRRDFHYIKFVNFPELTRFGDSCTRHTWQLAVHTEVVLQGNSRIGLGSSLNFHILFGFNRLVQTIGITTTVHNTTCLFIDDEHFVINYYILYIFFKEGVGFEQLVKGVNAFAFYAKILE